MHPIESLRKATDNEIIKINRAGGPAFVEKMKDFYPVVIGSTRKEEVDNGQTQFQEVEGDSLMGLLFIDNKGTVADKFLLNAILNGQPIELDFGTETTQGKDSSTIDI